jgi:hypothetical protein
MVTRRTVLKRGAALGLGGLLYGGVGWSRADESVRMILPSVTHDTIALKVLLDRPPSAAPQLAIDAQRVAGKATDGDGYAWQFIQNGLKGGTAHTLTLRDDTGRSLREPWQVRTLPPPDSSPSHFRVLFFTCAGGDEALSALAVSTRRALFDRALSFSPDLAVANGDHIYWDLRTALLYRRTPEARAKRAEQYHRIAWIDEDSAFDSATNRRSLMTVVGRQIASIYEDRFASVPMLFVADDHDYFENDNAGTWGCSFPPRPFTMNLQKRTADMAYPVALGRPDLTDRMASYTVEAVRVGRLLEINTFECRRGWSNGPNERFLFPEAERYLNGRAARSTAQQYIQVPSVPLGWTAGKLGEWYDGGPVGQAQTSLDKDKIYWKKGWFEQHQRLTAALSARKNRAAISISGDMHASAASSMTRSGNVDFSANPIHTILPGPIGTTVFPSTSRGLVPGHPGILEINDYAKMEERNGFTIADVYPDRVDVRQFRWRSPETVAAIAALEPAATFSIRRVN